MKRSSIFLATAFVAAIACAFAPKPHPKAIAQHRFQRAGYAYPSCTAEDCDQFGCNVITTGVTCTIGGATAYNTPAECEAQSGTVLEYNP